MLVRVETIVSKRTGKGRKKRRRLHLKCDVCGKRFHRPFSMGKALAPMHIHSRECHRQAQLKGGLIDRRKKAVFMRNLGYDHPLKVPRIKARIVAGAAKAQAKKRRTTRKRYGVDHTWQADSVKAKYLA